MPPCASGRDTLPSVSTIYRVFKRYHLNRRTPAMREEKRRIIKDKLGELGHIDLHQLRATCSSRHPLHDLCGQPDRQLLAPGLAEVITSKESLAGDVSGR